MTIADRPARLTDEQIAALTEPELVALRILLDRLMPLAAAIERAGGGHFSDHRARHGRGLHHPFHRGLSMPMQFETAAERDARIMRQRALAQPCAIHCDDAPVSTCETAAEVQARLARQEDARLASIAGVLDDRHRVRLAELRRMSDSGEADRLAERLIDRLVDGASPTEARRLLCIARNALSGATCSSASPESVRCG